MSDPDKALYAKKTRTLEQAAHAAFEIAAAEKLPIAASYRGDPEIWHRQSILKTVPVYGTREDRTEQVPATARLYGDHATLDFDEWSDLTVEGADFQRYLEWLHTFW
jgi:hypothetical protein